VSNKVQNLQTLPQEKRVSYTPGSLDFAKPRPPGKPQHFSLK